MSQSNPATPSVVANTANGRQQVPLRDYLNARVAPFLKKAITESLGVDAEFPLQWLGECLIHQSILYEGNPDATKIRERFVYKFEDPKPQEKSSSPTEPNLAPAPAETVPAQPEARRTDVVPDAVVAATPGQPESSTATQPVTTESQSISSQPVVNGVKHEADTGEENATKDTDVEMGGVS